MSSVSCSHMLDESDEPVLSLELLRRHAADERSAPCAALPLDGTLAGFVRLRAAGRCSGSALSSRRTCTRTDAFVCSCAVALGHGHGSAKDSAQQYDYSWGPFRVMQQR